MALKLWVVRSYQRHVFHLVARNMVCGGYKQQCLKNNSPKKVDFFMGEGGLLYRMFPIVLFQTCWRLLWWSICILPQTLCSSSWDSLSPSSLELRVIAWTWPNLHRKFIGLRFSEVAKPHCATSQFTHFTMSTPQSFK